MFGKKKRLLEQKVQSLELQLAQERADHESTFRQLQQLRERMEVEERVLRELREACQQKMRELDSREQQYELERAKLMQSLEEEIQQKRQAVEQELQDKVEVFSSNYNFYLLQLQRAMNRLTDTAVQTGKVLLTDDADPTELFRAQMSKGLELENADNCAEEDFANPFTAQEDAPALKELTASQEIPAASEAKTPLSTETAEQLEKAWETLSKTGKGFPKYKLLSILTAVCMLVTAVGFSRLDRDVAVPRYHQHLEQPSEADLGECEACGGKSSLCTHLPLIRIETAGQKIPGLPIMDENFIPVDYELSDNGEEMIAAELSTVEEEGVWHHADDPSFYDSSVLLRYRGNTSRAFSKHSFLLKLVEKDNPLQNRSLPLLGMAADNEWALYGPFLDKTLLRNYMWMNISAEVMGYAPAVRFCELILDGEYQGVYLLMETIGEGNGRVKLTPYEEGDLVCSYIVRIGTRMNPLKVINNFSYYTKRLEARHEVEVLYPGLLWQTEHVQEYIRTDFSEIERLLYSSNMNDKSGLYRDYLDVDSFVNYYILQEFLAVNDMFSESTYFYRDVRGKLHIGPVWDYNNALDNFVRPLDMESFILSQRGWYARLMMDEEFVERVIARYRELRKDTMSDERLNAYVDETIAWLGGAADRNYKVWGYTFEPENLSRVEYRQPPIDEVREIWKTDPENAPRILVERTRELNPANYEQAVEWLKESMTKRGAWMDEHIESLRQYCADSKNASRLAV